MRVGSCVSKRGTLQSGALKVSAQGKTVKVPVKIIQGLEKGKVAFVSAGLHGDELNGINIVSTFLQRLDPTAFAGTLIVLPLVNPVAFFHGERKGPDDGQDLNRCFGQRGTTFSYRLARAFFGQVVAVSDFGLDFHDSSKRYILLPHTRIFHKEYKGVAELSRKFGTEIVMMRKAQRGMLALEAVRRARVPVLTIEIGGGMNVLPHYLHEGLRGLNNVLVHHGLLDGEVSVPQRQFILSERIGYRSSLQGILHIKKTLGHLVEKDEVVGEVFNPLAERTIQLQAKDPGVLFSIKAQSHINARERAFSILHFTKHRQEIVPRDAKVVVNKETALVRVYTSGVFNKALELMRQQSKSFFEALLRE